MSVLDDVPPIPVEVGPCRCAGSPHPVDVVYLHAKAPLALGIEASVDIQLGKDVTDLSTRLMTAYVRHGVADWTFLDDDGQAIPVTPENAVRVLTWGEGGREVADRAAGLYNDAVMRPLVERAAKRSRATPTAPSTSTTTPSSPRRQKRAA